MNISNYMIFFIEIIDTTSLFKKVFKRIMVKKSNNNFMKILYLGVIGWILYLIIVGEGGFQTSSSEQNIKEKIDINGWIENVFFPGKNYVLSMFRTSQLDPEMLLEVDYGIPIYGYIEDECSLEYEMANAYKEIYGDLSVMPVAGEAYDLNQNFYFENENYIVELPEDVMVMTTGENVVMDNSQQVTNANENAMRENLMQDMNGNENNMTEYMMRDINTNDNRTETYISDMNANEMNVENNLASEMYIGDVEFDLARLTEQMEEENAIKSRGSNGFMPANVKQNEYLLSDLQSNEYLMKNFYAVDAGTTAPLELLNANTLINMDMVVDKNVEGPQILIYHTHSQESFADSVYGDSSTTIVGAGELLANILEEEYGYRVMHHTGEYDTVQHDYAYSYAEPEISKILAENPSIQVVIDLHRDEVAEGRKLVTEYNGVPVAQFMFFNGMSYVNGTGPVTYLENPNLQTNLAFSFQMQKAANEYYPGMARRIYLKGYRYNMHLAPRYLLIELGAQTNTVEEVMNACYPLADILDKVIGEE